VVIAMTPSTHQMIQQAGALAVTVALLLTLTVALLRLAAVPLAVAAVVLDKGAELAARPLTFTASPDWRARR
jgi:hypothetical protein